MPDLNLYTVGWICAIPTEAVAASAFLDEEHEQPDFTEPRDTNTYILGKIGKHSVAIASLPLGVYGIAPAKGVALRMLMTFPNLKFGLMVGIAGGVYRPDADIRLGDVVVSCPTGQHGGVFQYDFVKDIQGQEELLHIGSLNQPPELLLTALTSIQVDHRRKGHKLLADINTVLERNPRIKKDFQRPSKDSDRLFRSYIIHQDGSNCAETCFKSLESLVDRPDRSPDADDPTIHYGLIGSANSLMKNAINRDRLAKKHGFLCFEMEAAGLMNSFPCVVIRGICDYADSHKNNDWQGYAAMTAAAFAKDLLSHIPPYKVEAEKKISQVLSSINEKFDALHLTAEKTKTITETMQADHQLVKVERWLRPPDYTSNLAMAKQNRYKDTGGWILDIAAYQEWKKAKRQHLWLHGPLGCGKTILSTVIFDDVKVSTTTLIFFFDSRDSSKQTLENLFCSLIFQLYRVSTDISAKVDRFYASNAWLHKPDIDALSTLVQHLLDTIDRTVIIIDALDECDTRSELLAWLEGLDAPNVQLIITSRPEGEFQRRVPILFSEDNCIALDKQSIDKDIEFYVNTRLEQDKAFAFLHKNLHADLQQQIRDKIGMKADGMFQWAACQLDRLAKCLHRKAVIEALDTLPQDLDETYQEMIYSLSSEHETYAIRLLQFLAHAKRPLLASEAIDIVATEIDEENEGFDKDQRLFCETYLTNYFPGMVVMSKNIKMGQTVQELQLTHFSVKEFLLRQDPFKLKEAATAITKTCLTYLNCVQGFGKAIAVEFPLADHAAELIMDHAATAAMSPNMTSALVAFFKDKNAFMRWTSLLKTAYGKFEENQDTKRLFYACCAGLSSVAKVLIEEGAAVNAKCEVMRYFDIPRSWIKIRYSGSETKLPDGMFVSRSYTETALIGACQAGREEMITQLLDAKAHVDDTSSFFGSALSVASNTGNLKVSRQLIASGANVNVIGGVFGSALITASAAGEHEITKELIQAGANVNFRWRDGITALMLASQEGHGEIVRQLLAAKADANAQCKFGCALTYASREGHEEVVRILLAAQAGVNTRSDLDCALTYALRGGHQEIAQQLASAGADANAKVEWEIPKQKFWTPPRHCCYHGVSTNCPVDTEGTVPGDDVELMGYNQTGEIEIGEMEMMDMLYASVWMESMKEGAGYMKRHGKDGKEEHANSGDDIKKLCSSCGLPRRPSN